jgi:hypothetical protein
MKKWGTGLICPLLAPATIGELFARTWVFWISSSPVACGTLLFAHSSECTNRVGGVSVTAVDVAVPLFKTFSKSEPQAVSYVGAAPPHPLNRDRFATAHAAFIYITIAHACGHVCYKAMHQWIACLCVQVRAYVHSVQHPVREVRARCELLIQALCSQLNCMYAQVAKCVHWM